MSNQIMMKLPASTKAMLFPTIDLSAPLTPDALMSYCQTRLRGLDEQVQAAFYKQQLANADSSILNKLASDIYQPKDDVDLGCGGGCATALAEANKMLAAAEGIQDPATKQKLIDAANAIIDKVQTAENDRIGYDKDGKLLTPSYDVRKALAEGKSPQEIGGAIDSTAQCGLNVSIDRKVSASQFKAMTYDAVGGIQKDLNAGTELSMINLQSLMSQRQSSVQLITNMVQSLGDQMNKIAANIGH